MNCKIPVPATTMSKTRKIQSVSWECLYCGSALVKRPCMANTVVISNPAVAARPKACTRQSTPGPDAMSFKKNMISTSIVT